MDNSKRMERMRKHIVICPHCNKEVLDHMTQCPFCKGPLTPKGYSPMMSDETKRRVKRTTNIIFWTVAAGIIIYLFLTRFVLNK